MLNNTVCTVIVTYNRCDLLQESLEANLNQSLKPDCLIIVDNASTDGTYSMLRNNGFVGIGKERQIEIEKVGVKYEQSECFKEEVKIIYLRKNQNDGGSGGFYTGIREAHRLGYDHIWIMDDDAIPETLCLQSLMSSKYSSDKCVVACTPRKIGLDQKEQFHHYGYLNGLFKQVQLPKDRSDEMLVDYASFVGLLIKRSVVDVIGLPEYGFFIWHDDLEYSIRISKLGEILFVNQACIVHKTIEPSDAINREPNVFKYYYGHRNRAITIKKHSPVFKSLLLIPYYYLLSLGKILIYNKNKFKYFRTRTKALIDALKY